MVSRLETVTLKSSHGLSCFLNCVIVCKIVCVQRILLLAINCKLLNIVSPKSFVFSQFHVDSFHDLS